MTCGAGCLENYLLTMSCCVSLDLMGVVTRDVDQLSGGELQRFAIAIVCVQKADMYVYF